MTQKVLSLKLTEEEAKVIEQLKGDMKNADFIRMVLRTSTFVDDRTRQMGLDTQWVFRNKKHGGKRTGAGRPPGSPNVKQPPTHQPDDLS